MSKLLVPQLKRWPELFAEELYIFFCSFFYCFLEIYRFVIYSSLIFLANFLNDGWLFSKVVSQTFRENHPTFYEKEQNLYKNPA